MFTAIFSYISCFQLQDSKSDFTKDMFKLNVNHSFVISKNLQRYIYELAIFFKLRNKTLKQSYSDYVNQLTKDTISLKPFVKPNKIMNGFC